MLDRVELFYFYKFARHPKIIESLSASKARLKCNT